MTKYRVKGFLVGCCTKKILVIVNGSLFDLWLIAVTDSNAEHLPVNATNLFPCSSHVKEEWHKNGHASHTSNTPERGEEVKVSLA